MPFDGNTVDQVGELLLKAADLIEDKGWCQRRLCDTAGRHCIIGAVWAVMPPQANPDTRLDIVQIARHRLYAALRFDRYRSLATWNDQAGRTKKEVVTTLRRAAQSE